MSEAETADLAGQVTADGLLEGTVPRQPRPSRRRPRQVQSRTYRLRMDIDGAKPPIWRCLAVDSHLTLADLHVAIQVSFGWLDYHLHRFASGGSVWDATSELYLCPFDVDEGEEEGIPEAEVRLDEVLADPGDTLTYVYDYGDHWELQIRLEEVSERGDESSVRCLDGHRAGPPEDSGGIHGYQQMLDDVRDPSSPEHGQLAEWLASYTGGEPWDATRFDIDEVNATLASEFAPGLRAAYYTPLLGGLLLQVKGRGSGEDLTAVLADAHLDVPAQPTPAESEELVRRYQWLLRRIGDGIRLTAAGYLPPVHVEAAMHALDLDRGWIGKGNREDLTWPVLQLRQTAEQLGLLRKSRGDLLPTKVGRALTDDPVALCRHVAVRLPLGKTGQSEQQAGAVLLALVAAGRRVHWSQSPTDPYGLMAQVLHDLGWRLSDGTAIGADAAGHQAGRTLHVLEQLAVFESEDRFGRLGPPTHAGRIFARLALQTP